MTAQDPSLDRRIGGASRAADVTAQDPSLDRRSPDASSSSKRVRVTGDGSLNTAAITVPMQGGADPDTAYARSLVRAQLRLALGCLLGFLVCAGGLAVVMLTIPQLASVVLVGVPLPWLLHAYGFYPIIAVFAGIYVFSATRNERRYRVLRGQSS